ncbi:Rad1/Rec1/Rad17 [Lipomyces japonicus]|uniref:Rad1/Rec1/Rad17 n=1 Tax=Lipomyces japonicus TaxID=56871 RepID=UPI0034CE3C5C
MNSLSSTPPVLDAVSTSIGFIFRLLKSIALVSTRTRATVTSTGITFTVSHAQVVQATVFLSKSLFTSYQFNSPYGSKESQNETLSSRLQQRARKRKRDSNDHDDDGDGDDDGLNAAVPISLSLGSLVECLQIFGSTDLTRTSSSKGPEDEPGVKQFLTSSSTCKIRYEGPGSPFILMLKDGSLTTTCEFVTFDDLDGLDDDDDTDYGANMYDDNKTGNAGGRVIRFNSDTVSVLYIMKSQFLEDAVRELDMPGADSVLITVAPASPPQSSHPTLKLIAQGEIGSVEYCFPRNHAIGERFVYRRNDKYNDDNHDDNHDNNNSDDDDDDEIVSNRYPLSSVQKIREAVKLAQKLNLRMDDNGVLDIQFMCDIGDGRQSFIDFRFLPLHDDDEHSRTQAS